MNLSKLAILACAVAFQTTQAFALECSSQINCSGSAVGHSRSGSVPVDLTLQTWGATITAKVSVGNGSTQTYHLGCNPQTGGDKIRLSSGNEITLEELATDTDGTSQFSATIQDGNEQISVDSITCQ